MASKPKRSTTSNMDEINQLVQGYVRPKACVFCVHPEVVEDLDWWLSSMELEESRLPLADISDWFFDRYPKVFPRGTRGRLKAYNRLRYHIRDSKHVGIEGDESQERWLALGELVRREE